MKTLAELNDRLTEITTRSGHIVDTASEAKIDLTEPEQGELDNLITEFETVKQNRDRLQTLETQTASLAKSAGRSADPAGGDPVDPTPAHRHKPVVTGGEFRNDDKRRFGWSSLGEQAQAIRAAARPGGGTIDKRLLTEHRSGTAPGTFGSELQGADGGFAVAPDFRNDIMQKVDGEDSLLARTDQHTSNSNAVTFPQDETTPWQTSGGIQAFWEGEGDEATQSKVSLKANTLRLAKLRALVPVTDELMEDTSFLDGYLTRKAGEKIDFAVTLGIIQGTGAGQPEGILNSNCLVSVAKEGSQVADTVVSQNIIKMWSRCYAPSRRRAVWLINQDVEPQLNAMSLIGKLATGADDTGWGVNTYMPAGGLSQAPFATLYGRPVVPTQGCNTLGDEGDIILADLKEYLTIQKSGGIRQSTSVHLWFDYDTMAFKFVLRIGGTSWFTAAITPRSGSNTLSPFVTLAVRG